MNMKSHWRPKIRPVLPSQMGEYKLCEFYWDYCYYEPDAMNGRPFLYYGGEFFSEHRYKDEIRYGHTVIGPSDPWKTSYIVQVIGFLPLFDVPICVNEKTTRHLDFQDSHDSHCYVDQIDEKMWALTYTNHRGKVIYHTHVKAAPESRYSAEVEIRFDQNMLQIGSNYFALEGEAPLQQ